jgi:hypothetical protein
MFVEWLYKICSIHNGECKCHGEMTNAYEILVGSFKDTEYSWEDNMKPDGRQT